MWTPGPRRLKMTGLQHQHHPLQVAPLPLPLTSPPCISPYSSPGLHCRNWFHLHPAPLFAAPETHSPNPSADMGGNEGGRERWHFLVLRSVVQKSFRARAGGGLLRISAGQNKIAVDDPAKLIPPKIEISYTEAMWQTSWPHKLKPWDMNVLTPPGF
uniref:Putative monooxygenase p33MONOX n=1 Tax=Neolamprologus brichardi TaxID=32507 RepID=A0A3Q4G8R9_NEOBR